jgi:hypothetical protein
MQVKIQKAEKTVKVVRARKLKTGSATLGEFIDEQRARVYIAEKSHVVVGEAA